LLEGRAQRVHRLAERVFLLVVLAVAPDVQAQCSDRALTTDTPTPCRPPDTL
jgi:hypothetical protein